MNYQDSALSAGKAGKVEGGDRLPWVEVGGADNFAPLAHIGWQVHVYGTAAAELKAWGKYQGIQVHEFEWNAKHEEAGLARGAAYLLRPELCGVRGTSCIGGSVGSIFERAESHAFSMTEAKWRRRKGARSAEIIEAATEIFIRAGYAAANLDDVAQQAGIAKGTLYRYFADKQSLFRAVVQQAIELNFATLKQPATA